MRDSNGFPRLRHSTMSNAPGIIIKPLMTQINRQTPVGEAVAYTRKGFFSLGKFAQFALLAK
jgi:hypothetical protein